MAAMLVRGDELPGVFCAGFTACESRPVMGLTSWEADESSEGNASGTEEGSSPSSSEGRGGRAPPASWRGRAPGLRRPGRGHGGSSAALSGRKRFQDTCLCYVLQLRKAGREVGGASGRSRNARAARGQLHWCQRVAEELPQLSCGSAAARALVAATAATASRQRAARAEELLFVFSFFPPGF